MTMTTSPPSRSSQAPEPDAAGAFARLHPKIQRWIWDEGWEQLRPIQARAIGPILEGESDVIVSAATAGGKTEAAWLPIFSALATAEDDGTSDLGVKALMLSPLKALINDQADRLDPMAEAVDLPLYRRHGDVTGRDRTQLLKQPDGIVLVTPESLEALFVNYGTRIPAIFAGLRYVVVDELHAFIGTERGAQVQSLLHRVELAIRRHVPRIALSATLADPRAAAEFLRPGHGGDVTVIGSADDDRAELRLQIRGYFKQAVKGPLDRGPMGIYATIADREAKRSAADIVAQMEARKEALLAAGNELPAELRGDLVVAEAAAPEPGVPDDPDAPDAPDDTVTIAEHIFRTLRGKDNLVFANTKEKVEVYADRLRRACEDARLPNEFYPHHGSLSKELREDVERMLKASDIHATAICTSTLEMGIDIGSADAIAQIAAPNSVAGLRQRVGRSGRRGQPSTLRIYITEEALTKNTHPVDQLRSETFQAIAAVDLLLAKWYEPPNTRGLHLSTLVQQVLSAIAQHGGATARQLYSALCEDGPFVHVTKPMFAQLLRDLGEHDLIVQASDGLLLHGVEGERLVNHYSFYTAFVTPEEYRVVSGGKEIGTLPVEFPLVVGQLIVFAASRWRIVEIDQVARIIELERSSGGDPPSFSGSKAAIDDGVRLRMRDFYESPDIPIYLDRNAKQLLAEGRAAYRHLRLKEEPVYSWGGDSFIFPWRGDRVMNTLMMVLAQRAVNVGMEGVAIVCRDASPEHIRRLLREMAGSAMPDAEELAAGVTVKEKEKFDQFLSDDLLTAGYAARDLDVPGAWAALRDLGYR
ncbi:MAG TPA: DEAD/DEAH box helicase [Thermomicrobiales bacterium]|nr:DEAD/DEAH box helicase [Thermomicrobiales bacterium]